AYFRQGVALQYLGRHADALAAFASGLAQDPKSLQLLVGMVEAAMKSPLRESLEPTYQQLQKMKLDKSPFVVVSVIGQELLTAGHHTASVVVLEAALKIGTCSLKLRGSVFSALSSAHWSLGNTEKSTGYMQQDLEVAKTLGDQTGECRAHGNLGSAFFSKGNYREALTNHRNQLVLAMKLKDREAASMALSSLGHVYTAIGDYPNALASHKQCVLLAKQSKDQLSEARELGNMGAVYIAMGDFDNAVQCHEQHLGIAKALENKREEARAYSNLGSAYHYHRNFDKAMSYHTHVLELAQELEEKSIEMRAYAGLGHAARCMQDLERAKQYHEQQLSIAEGLKDRAAEGRASSNLGMYVKQKIMNSLCQLSGNEAVMDRGRAYGNLGDCYEALGDFEEAIKYYDQYLSVAQSLNRMQDQEKAYRGSFRIFECCWRENYLMIPSIDPKMAVTYFILNVLSPCYLSHLTPNVLHPDAQWFSVFNFRAMGNLQQSLVCFEKRLVVAHELGECGGKAQAYGELGALHSQLGNYEQAISCLERQLAIARDTQDRLLEGDASCGLGAVYQSMGEYETALRCHQSDLEIAEEAGSPTRQARAYGNLGLTYESLGNYERAVVFQEQHLSVAAQTNDLAAKTLAYGSLGRTHHALQNYSQAVMYLQEGLRLAEQLARREDEAKIRHRLGLSLWASGNLEEAQHQLYRASALFETIRHEAQHSTDYKLSLFDLQTSCYQALQRVLVSLGHHDEALAVAERGRTRAFADLLVERQTGQQDSDPYTPVTVEHILDTVNSQRALVLYFSMAAGYLYSWLLAPGAGILKFHEVYLGEGVSEGGSDFQEGGSVGVVSGSSLEQHIASAREALGVESYYSRGCSSSETESEAGDLLDQQFEELNNKLNSVTDPTGFLRMVSRNNLFNRSCQSMTSLFSNTMSPAKDGNSSLPRRSSNLGKPPLRALYDLLIAPMEGGLMHSSGPVGRHRQLVMVLEGELYLIPFALLKGSSSNEYLYERFSLIAVPSIHGLGSSTHSRRPGPAPCGGVSMAAVVGNPRLPSPVMDRWLWGPMPSAEEEALMVAELLGCQPLAGCSATKERVMSALTQAECAHFATHISWKLAALVLTPNPEGVPGGASRKGSIGSGYTIPESLHMQDDSSDVESICDSPPLQEFLLTAADILDLRLPVKLVVLGSYQESSSKVTADGVVGLTRAFLAAGAQCVLVSLWPVPVAASKVFVHAFYTALLNGTKASAALADAMKTVQSSKQYSHPSNWAGYMLIGNDVKLNSPSSLIGQALAEILQYPDRVRDALRVLLHLVEKSLQRIQNGQRNSMYTSQQSVENKVGGVPGWQALLTAVGFRLDSAGTGIPAAVFFPTADPGDRLQQCSTTLQSLLGLPPPALQALCKLITASEAGEQLINRAVKNMVAMLHQVLVQLQTGEKEQDFSLLPIQVSISVQLWRLPGCHEFLAALGFDLCEVGQEEVVLKTGKLANRRTLHFALQSLLALFDSTELPKRLSLDSSSSLESLASAQSVSNPLPMGYSSLPFSPPCLDNQASDAISVYSLSSVASSMSFASKSDCDFLGHRQRSGVTAHYSIHKHPHVPRSRSSPHGAAAAVAGARGDEEEYEGFSIISSEPLGSHCDSLPLPPGHSQRHHRGTGRGYTVSVSSRGSVSTPTSPVKTCLVPSPNSPFQKVGKVSSSDTGESDQSSTETDSTVKSQEEKTVPLDPQELAQKILEETQSHLRAVGSLQRAGAEGGTTGGTSARSSAFRSSETSAFSRPNSSASGRAQSSPRPKPPSRSSSLQKISSGYNSPAVSESSQKEGSHPSPTLDSHAQFKLKYPSSPYSGHISRSPSNVSPSSGHQSPAGSAPSPALSYSSTGSACSTSADAPDLDRLRRGVIDEKVQAIHNLKTFWANAAAQQQQHLGPVKAVHGAPGPLASASRDVLSLLNLSPRHCSPNETQDSLELRELGLQSLERGSKNSSNGHHCSNPRKVAPSPTISTSSSPGARSIRLPAGNGYKFLSPGRFFPSSKC
uniref:Tetratricopeptide repeat domain 28 n=1 Tax=Echeneis naucrates TaxID=173247 RepID=A0A665VJJ7_ECHNA